jgi:hypothetical protein
MSVVFSSADNPTVEAPFRSVLGQGVVPEPIDLLQQGLTIVV